MTKLHLVYIMFERVKAKLSSIVLNDPNVSKILMTVLTNFALKQLQIEVSPLYESGFFGPGSA